MPLLQNIIIKSLKRLFDMTHLIFPNILLMLFLSFINLFLLNKDRIFLNKDSLKNNYSFDYINSVHSYFF